MDADPAALRAFVLSRPETRPGDLQREFRVGWNRACSLLEALEREGIIERPSLLGRKIDPLPGRELVWTPAPTAKPPHGFALPLTSKEHGALLRLLDWCLSDPDTEEHAPGDNATLRAIRNRLKRPGGGS